MAAMASVNQAKPEPETWSLEFWQRGPHTWAILHCCPKGGVSRAGSGSSAFKTGTGAPVGGCCHMQWLIVLHHSATLCRSSYEIGMREAWASPSCDLHAQNCPVFFLPDIHTQVVLFFKNNPCKNIGFSQARPF